MCVHISFVIYLLLYMIGMLCKCVCIYIYICKYTYINILFYFDNVDYIATPVVIKLDHKSSCLCV